MSETTICPDEHDFVVKALALEEADHKLTKGALESTRETLKEERAKRCQFQTTLNGIRALMKCRRAMGDLGREVVVHPDDFEALLPEIYRGGEPSTPTKARCTGQFSILTCNGETTIKRAP